MPLDPKHLPTIVTFFTSPAWADLRGLIENATPSYPAISADALTTTSQCRRREGYELCLKSLLREAGVTPVPVEQAQKDDKDKTMQEQMRELLEEGRYVDTTKD